MGLLNKIRSWFRPDHFNKEGLVIVEAFTIGGIDYLELDNIYNLPYERGKAAIRVYEEVRMKCDYEYLKAHVTAVNNIFEPVDTGKKKQIGWKEISEIKTLNDRLKERLYNIVDTDIIYKLASVVFFDKTESPIDYDFKYAQKKIAHWKRHKEVGAFFLQEPIQRLIPFLKLPETSFQTYSETIQAINKIHWEGVFSLLLPSQRKDFSETFDYYVGETQQKLSR